MVTREMAAYRGAATTIDPDEGSVGQREATAEHHARCALDEGPKRAQQRFMDPFQSERGTKLEINDVDLTTTAFTTYT
jgi:hypothetical protein